MIKKIFFVTFLIIFLCSCSTTQYISYEKFARQAEFNKVHGKSAKVLLKNGKVMQVTKMHAYQDSISWRKKLTGRKQTVPAEDVEGIYIKDRKAGALTGLGLGILGGLVSGLIIVSASGESNKDDPNCDDLSELIVYTGGEAMESMSKIIVPLLTTGAGSLLGLGIGAGAGVNDRYIFSAQADSLEQVKKMKKTKANDHPPDFLIREQFK